MLRLRLALLLLPSIGGLAWAETPRPDRGIWPVRPEGGARVDAGLVMNFPIGLQTGLATGLGAGVMLGRGFSWGLRGSWSTATESSLVWTVTHAESRLRAATAIAAAAGRGSLALRLGAGPTIIHETRVRNQGMRAGLAGTDLQTSSTTTVPTCDLEAVVSVHIAGAWFVTLSGGPTVSIFDSAARAGFTGQVGAGWHS